MHLRCSEIFNNHCITQSLLSDLVKEFCKWSTFGKVMGKSRVSCFIDSLGGCCVTLVNVYIY